MSETQTLPPLTVNDGTLPPHSTLRLHPSSPTEPLSTLRARYNRDGYLFLKSLLPRADILSYRTSYFTLLAPTGVLAPGTSPTAGIFDATKPPHMYPGVGTATNPGKAPDPTAAAFVDLAIKAHTEEWYTEGLCKHPALLEFVRDITGWGEGMLALRRTLLRNNTPGNRAIGVHYDQTFLRGGAATAVTAWVPLGDVGLEGGGLIYLEDGDEVGREIEKGFEEEAKRTGLSDEEAKNAFNQNMMATGWLADGPLAFGQEHGKRWMVAEYEAGDVVLHKPHMIHASTVNTDPDNKIRLATDLRFVNSAEPYDERWMGDYRPDDGL